MLGIAMRAVLPMLILAGLTACQSLRSPGISLKDARMAEGPVIIQRGDHFYLRYRRALEDGGRYPLLSVLYVRKTKDAGYYFFSVPISHVEWGSLVERPLAYDELEDFAGRGQIYWLDPDGTKHQIPVRLEPNNAVEPTSALTGARGSP
jgi:hypothetical protein